VSYIIVYIELHILSRWDINEERNSELDKADRMAVAIFTHSLQHIVKKKNNNNYHFQRPR